LPSATDGGILTAGNPRRPQAAGTIAGAAASRMDRERADETQMAAPSLAHVLMLGFAGFFAALLAAGGGAAPWLFPAAAVALGGLLYVRYPVLYIAFVWWLWFLTPLVRRIADYQGGWNPMSPVMLAPSLVSMFAAITFVRFLPLLRLKAYLPFLLVLIGLVYAYLIGVVRSGPAAATYGFLTWATPVLFGFHVAATWRRYPEYVRVLTSTFLSGVLVMGIYGLIQYFYLPAWDAYWMRNAQMNSIGLPYPLLVRVFSTMNSSGPFADIIMGGLLLVFSAKGRWPWVSAVPGYVVFFLSGVRAAWGSWLVGFIVLLFRMKSAHKVKLVGVTAALILVILPAVTAVPLVDKVTSRLQTITEIQEDHSFRERVQFYKDFMPHAASNVVGEGLGSTGVSTKLGNEGNLGELGDFDSGIMNILFVLGWPGCIVYGLGVLWSTLSVINAKFATRDTFAHVAVAIAIATLARLIFSNSLVGVSGMLFWTFCGAALAAHFSGNVGATDKTAPAEFHGLHFPLKGSLSGRAE
jgi:hypothetical protein